MDNNVLDTILGPSGALVFAILVLYGGWRKWWVFGWQYRDAISERDEWKKAALDGTRVAKRAFDLAQSKFQREGEG